jgi:hypothetical protein
MFEAEKRPRRCQACSAVIDLPDPIGRRESCPTCGVDLHACIQCEFYDPSAPNQCREPEADRVVSKDQANFCELFRLSREAGSGRRNEAELARAKLEALFKK